MSTGDGLGHCYGTNGEFCVTAGPVPEPLAYWPSWLKALVVNEAGHLADVGHYASLIALTGLTLRYMFPLSPWWRRPC